MTTITFGGLDAASHTVKVFIDGRHRGTIKREHEAGSDGWRYYPKGNKYGGDFYSTLAACKRSLEG